MDSSFDLHAPITILISFWVLDFAYFLYDQYQKINVFLIEIERTDTDGTNATRIIVRALVGEIFSAISLSLKIISMLFFAVVYQNIGDENFVLVLHKYSGRLAMTSNFFAAATAALLAVSLLLAAYSYCRASARKSSDPRGPSKSSPSCGRGALAMPLLRERGDEIAPRMVVAATGV